MAYLGKEYKFVKEDNFDGFLKAIGVKDEDIAKLAHYKPATKLTKDGDYYVFTFTDPLKTKEVKFKSGVEQDEEIRDGSKVKTTYTVDGNVITQVLKRDDKSATFKREFDGDNLTVTITASQWDGVAHRYYKA
ncbi:fatty acid-binding protein 1-like [Plodia interpunctella]|uniref:fatty acid-binding protein 1-like n=1 Tax=Plodia interpunctella TaxID=58824 RepID=UPI0023688D36|nr:fatty acid-binding protein 1-like [Plodia interpunctella]